MEIDIYVNFGLKFWNHEREWIQYLKAKHLRFGWKITSAHLVAKLNSKNDIRAKGIFHPAEIHWVTNLDATLHTHMNTSWVSCYHALTMTESLNKRILSEIVPIDSEVCR